MSTNHNRIRVADLETNQPNKILKTNAKGQLEFSDANNLQTENYNALDYTTEGKALDARQGKVLKDMIDNVSSSPISLVNDLTTGGASKTLTAEMGKQLNEIKHPLEDQRLSQDQTVKFGNVIVKDGKYATYVACYEVKSFNNETYFSTKLTPDAIIANSSDARRLEVKYNSINFIRDPYTDKKGSLLTNYLTGARSWFLQDKDGTLALTNDFVNTAAGTSIQPPLMIPNGTLTSIPANGAIERDDKGQLWETHNNVRSRLITSSDGITIPFKANSAIQTNISDAISKTVQSVSSNTVIGNIKNTSVMRLNLTNEVYFRSNSPALGNIEPTSAKTEVYLKINNGLFATDYTGVNATNQIKIIELSGLKNNGLKNYQSPFLTDIQNSNPLLAQWSTLRFLTQNITDGVTTNNEALYYLRDSENTRAFGAIEASFSFVFVNTVSYADAINSEGKNTSKIIRCNNLALYLETIR